MKLYDFKVRSKSYCLVKFDKYNFSVREYLVTEFKPADNFFGSLYAACRKVVRVQGGNHPARYIDSLKPYNLTEDNKEIYKDAIKECLG
jgi:uncharacterized membrane protein YgcG